MRFINLIKLINLIDLMLLDYSSGPSSWEAVAAEGVTT